MKTRIITAVVGIAVLIAVMCLFDMLLFDLVIAALTLLAMHEAWQAVGFQKKDFCCVIFCRGQRLDWFQTFYRALGWHLPTQQ